MFGCGSSNQQVDNADLMNWEQFFSTYSQTYNPAYQNFIENNDINMNSRLAFSSGEVTFAMCYAFFTKDAQKDLTEVFSYLGYENIEYFEEGDTAFFTANYGDLKVKYEMIYRNNTAQLTYSADGVLLEKMSVCICDSYIAKTYTDTEYECRYVIYGNGDIYIGKDKGKDDLKISLLDNHKKAKSPSFITNMAGVCKYVSGQLSFDGILA